MEKISKRLEQAFKQVNLLCATYLATVGRMEQQQDDDISVRSSKLKSKNRTVREPKQASRQDNGQDRRENEEKKKKNEERIQNKIMAPPGERPKQPLSAFFIFLQKNRKRFVDENPETAPTDISNKMGQMWRGMPEEQKSEYTQEAEFRKSIYQREMKLFYEKYPGEKDKKKIKKDRPKGRDRKEIKNEAIIMQRIKEIKDKKDQQRSQSESGSENENS